MSDLRTEDTELSEAIELLRAKLSPGPAVERGEDGRTVYRKPTLYDLVTRGVIAERSAVRFQFAFTMPDGRRLSYSADIEQDDLFALLYSNNLLTRREG